jgi:hypothetical protein
MAGGMLALTAGLLDGMPTRRKSNPIVATRTSHAPKNRICVHAINLDTRMAISRPRDLLGARRQNPVLQIACMHLQAGSNDGTPCSIHLAPLDLTFPPPPSPAPTRR